MTWLGRRAAEFARLRECARASGTPVAALAPRFLRFVLAEGYSPSEVLMLGLLRGDGPIDPRRFISKERMLAHQVRVNGREYFPYTEDKLVFFERCLAHGLPTPRVRGAYAASAADTGSALPVARDAVQLSRLLARHAPWDFVIKPVDGVHGQGVRVLRYADGALATTAGQRQTVDSLVARLSASAYRHWLLQDRLFPHDDLVALSGSAFLQTARLVTAIKPDGHVIVPAAWLRIIGGDSAFDNFNFGASGNLVGTLELPSGRLDHVLAPGPPGHGLVEAARHPGTGAAFERFRLPFAQEILDLVQRAAKAFAPLRTIGWDVAITPDGPSLIEGNVTWDPLPTKRDLREWLPALE